MTWPRITVVTPSYNQARFLTETIESVLCQDYPNLEYMIFDGGSSDGSADIIDKYRPQLAYGVSEKDHGQSDAINKGFARSTGDILCWLNSDDLFTPGTLRAVGEQMGEGEVDFLYGDGVLFWDKSVRPRRVVRTSQAKEDVRIRDRFQQPSTFWTRKVYETIGPLNEELHYAFDWEYFIRIADRFPMTHLPKALSAYRVHGAHKSGTGGKKRAEEIVAVMRKYAPPHWAELYTHVLPSYDALALTKQRFRRFYFLPFVATHPSIAAGKPLRDLKLVTSVL